MENSPKIKFYLGNNLSFWIFKWAKYIILTWSTSSSKLEATEWLDAASDIASRLSDVLPIEPSSWDRENLIEKKY